MSYCSTNWLPKGTRPADVEEFVRLLGYRKLRRPPKVERLIASYHWFQEVDYRSFSGIGLDIETDEDGTLVVSTRTPAARSYWDLDHQNATIKRIRTFLGGTFRTDAGQGRCWRAEEKPPSPPQCGAHIAFQNFGSGLIAASLFLDARVFPENWNRPRTGFPFLDFWNPRLLANNLLLPYLVALLEDYFKSTFVALLRYSPKKSAVFRKVRLSSDQVAAVGSQERSPEEALAENMSFQNVNAVCEHFRSLDPKLDFAPVLRRPFRRRSLYASLEELVMRRHALVHQASLDLNFEDVDAWRAIDDLERSVDRCYRHLTGLYGWEYDKGWSRGRRARSKEGPPNKPMELTRLPFSQADT